MRILFLIALVPLASCTVDLGECNAPVARRVVYSPSGTPAYEGQALIATSCGNASFCHSAGIDPEDRFGATVGLDFSVFIAETEAEAERLRANQANVREWKYDIFCDVDNGSMPPYGESTLIAHRGLERFRNAEGERLPFVDSFEGIDILRNWLACDAPVVERTTPHPAGRTPVGDVVPALLE